MFESVIEYAKQMDHRMIYAVCALAVVVVASFFLFRKKRHVIKVSDEHNIVYLNNTCITNMPVICALKNSDWRVFVEYNGKMVHFTYETKEEAERAAALMIESKMM